MIVRRFKYTYSCFSQMIIFSVNELHEGMLHIWLLICCDVVLICDLCCDIVMLFLCAAFV